MQWSGRTLFCLLAGAVVLCIFIQSVAAAESGKPPKPAFNIDKILSLDHATSEAEETINDAGLGLNRLFWSAEEWEEKASRHQQHLSGISGDMVYPDYILRRYGYEAAAAVTAREIAIDKYRKNPGSVKNDQKIADAYMSLAQTYSYLARQNSGYREYQLEALDDATDALPTKGAAWEEKINLLNQMGRTDEAQQAQAEYERVQRQTTAGYSLIGMLVPPSPLVTIIAAALGLGLFAMRKRR